MYAGHKRNHCKTIEYSGRPRGLPQLDIDRFGLEGHATILKLSTEPYQDNAPKSLINTSKELDFRLGARTRTHSLCQPRFRSIFICF